MLRFSGFETQPVFTKVVYNESINVNCSIKQEFSPVVTLKFINSDGVESQPGESFISNMKI